MRPDWLKIELPGPGEFARVRRILSRSNLATVCEEARCPNLGRCWGEGTATIMILGRVCTRRCRFCAVRTGNPKGGIDPEEPLRVAEAVRELGIQYLVITSVDRDDLKDFGAAQFARTIEAIKRVDPRVLVEALTPDFQGEVEAIRMVVRAGPDLVGHNLETVRRLTPKVRDPRSSYELSLRVLGLLKTLSPQIPLKSGLMLGLGETAAEVVEALTDLRISGVDILTLGQYLQPTPKHLKVERYWRPEEFEELVRKAKGLGFRAVASAPLVRSSYRARELWKMVQAG